MVNLQKWFLKKRVYYLGSHLDILGSAWEWKGIWANCKALGSVALERQGYGKEGQNSDLNLSLPGTSNIFNLKSFSLWIK